MQIPDEKSPLLAAAVKTHKATAMCATGTHRPSKQIRGRCLTLVKSEGKHRIQHSKPKCYFQPEAADSGFLAWGVAYKHERDSSLALVPVLHPVCASAQGGDPEFIALSWLTPKNAPSFFVTYSPSRSLEHMAS